ncbi:MAG: cbb3-type cytochrome oxidase maturation protein [Mariniblastus sp.]|jgi:cbb3-type cytochrome oxidase maturation protein
MSVLYIALPVALIVAVIAVVAFVVQVKSGQFDDLETPPRRMLFDDVQIKKRRDEPSEPSEPE